MPERVAVEEEGEFGDEGEADGDGGREVEGGGGGGGADDEAAEGEGDEDGGDGGHEEAEDDVAGGFDPGFAGGEAARVDFGDGLVAEEQGEVGGRVEDGVGHGGEEGERAGGDGGEELEDGKHDVGAEGAVDGDLIAELVGRAEVAGLADVFVHGPEEALDGGVLRLVEALELQVGPRVSGQVERVESVAFAACVGGDQVDLGLGLDPGREVEGVVFVGVGWRRLVLGVCASHHCSVARKVGLVCHGRGCCGAMG